MSVNHLRRYALGFVIVFAIGAAGVSPTVAFDTQNFTNHGTDWQKDVRRITEHMRPNGASVRDSTYKMVMRTDPYIKWLDTITPNACQAASFQKHHVSVLRYSLNLIDAWQALGRGHVRVANRYVGVAIRHYNAADAAGASIIRRCW